MPATTDTGDQYSLDAIVKGIADDLIALGNAGRQSQSGARISLHGE